MSGQIRSSKQSSRSLTVLFVASLLLIAVLSLVGHDLMSRSARGQKGNAEIISVAGRQEMLTQTIALATLAYAQSGQKADHDKLANAAFNFEAGYHYLAHLQSLPSNLDQQSQAYLAAAKSLVGWQKGDPDTIRGDAIKVIANAADSLTEGLEKADQAYQDQISGKVASLAQWQFGVTVLILLLLLLQAVLWMKKTVLR